MILLSFKESLTINFVKYFKIQRTLYWLLIHIHNFGHTSMHCIWIFSTSYLSTTLCLHTVFQHVIYSKSVCGKQTKKRTTMQHCGARYLHKGCTTQHILTKCCVQGKVSLPQIQLPSRNVLESSSVKTAELHHFL